MTIGQLKQVLEKETMRTEENMNQIYYTRI